MSLVVHRIADHRGYIANGLSQTNLFRNIDGDFFFHDRGRHHRPRLFGRFRCCAALSVRADAGSAIAAFAIAMPRPASSVQGFFPGSVQLQKHRLCLFQLPPQKDTVFRFPFIKLFLSRTSYPSITCSQSSQQVTFSIMPMSLTLRKLTSSPFSLWIRSSVPEICHVGVLPAPPFHFVSLLHGKPSCRPVHPISSKGRYPLLFYCHPVSSARPRCRNG